MSFQTGLLATYSNGKTSITVYPTTGLVCWNKHLARTPDHYEDFIIDLLKDGRFVIHDRSLLSHIYLSFRDERRTSVVALCKLKFCKEGPKLLLGMLRTVQAQVRKWLMKRSHARRLCVAMAMHSRLGAGSLMGVLPDHLAQLLI